MKYLLSDEIRHILDTQSKLEVEEDEASFIIQGVYVYSLDYDGYIVQGERTIKLVVQKDFPLSIPKFYVFDYPSQIEHIYKDGEVCLATIGELTHFLNEQPILKNFIDKFVNAFIFTIVWFEKYNTYPFGERKHGYKGLIDYYLNDLQLTKEQYQTMASMIYYNKYRGHHQCICGSGKKLRNCHGKYILPIIMNEKFKINFMDEYYFISSKDGKLW